MKFSSRYDREILHLAVPALGALAAEPLYLLADTAMVGHLGTEELAALAIAATLLAGTFTLPAPAIREAVHEFQSPAAGLVVVGVPRAGRGAAGVGHLHAYGLLLTARRGTGGTEEHPQHGGTAGVHDGVGYQFGDEQDQRLGDRFVGSYAGAGET